MNESLKPILAELKQRLTELYGERLSQLILFGSQARGDATEDSDVDVLVVLEGEVEPFVESDQVVPITADISLRLGVVICCMYISRAQYEARKSATLRNAAHEGIAL
ncbi:nucleotidyltransferase domain-containing protein [bacterium]|nr:nucleotidyltransferase domain-containing protein [bacterium]